MTTGVRLAPDSIPPGSIPPGSIPPGSIPPGSVLLDAHAATSCPVKTWHAYASGIQPPRSPNPILEQRRQARRRFVAEVLDSWAAALPAEVVDLRTIADRPHDERVDACRDVMRAGARVILGGVLAADQDEHRVGSPEALVRSEPGGSGYFPVLVRWHKMRAGTRAVGGADRSAEATELRGAVRLASLTRPGPADANEVPGAELRLASREPDFLQLAHHYRLLTSLGWAAGPFGGLIGTDDPPDKPMLTWVDLAEPRQVSGSPDPSGGRRLSLLERYDLGLTSRLAIADAARQNPAAEPVVWPVVTAECTDCPWWSRCRSRLDADDVSLRIEHGRLDRAEISALRVQGVRTVRQLANCNVERLLTDYLPAVGDRPNAETRLRVAARRAGMLTRGEALARETCGPIEVPAAAVEIDFDIETSLAGRIYLWGFRVAKVNNPQVPPRYVPFSRFSDLDEAGELELAGVALGWLRSQVCDGGALVYHYSGYEVAMIRALATRTSDPVLDWATGYAGRAFVDLLPIVQTHFFGAAGLGLKQVAAQTGFSWRDVDPGGLNSQLWFESAVHDADPAARAAARRRVLRYNEDDVLATARLRTWLRSQ